LQKVQKHAKLNILFRDTFIVGKTIKKTEELIVTKSQLMVTCKGERDMRRGLTGDGRALTCSLFQPW
jgi:hypothetical protein